MGGKSAPACGWAMGMERILELMKEQGLIEKEVPSCDVYWLHTGGQALIPSLIYAERLRSAGIDVIVHASSDGGSSGSSSSSSSRSSSSLKSQMKKADLSGAMYAVIIGEDELRTAEAMVKDLRSSGTQQLVALDGLLDYVIDLMVNHSD